MGINTKWIDECRKTALIVNPNSLSSHNPTHLVAPKKILYRSTKFEYSGAALLATPLALALALASVPDAVLNPFEAALSPFVTPLGAPTLPAMGAILPNKFAKLAAAPPAFDSTPGMELRTLIIVLVADVLSGVFPTTVPERIITSTELLSLELVRSSTLVLLFVFALQLQLR
jgi:hypothetical protein